MSNVRVRFAPSPTGFVHIGGLRTVLYNYLFAKKHDGTFVLRIEDTDRTRFVEGAIENIIEVLKWAGLEPDEGPDWDGNYGPYFQSQRMNLYQKYAQELLDKGHAYYAFDTPEELEQMRATFRTDDDPMPRYGYRVRRQMKNSLSMSDDKVHSRLRAGDPYVVRLLVPEDREFVFEDIIRGQVSIDSSEVDDQVLIKSDGYPTYHLANVVDDHLMEISHVIRGVEWLVSVPKHLLLYEYLGWQPPVMAHLPLINNPDGSKMSKRHIDRSGELKAGKVDPDVATYIQQGYEKTALLNYIALLGWNPGEGDEREVFSLKQLVEEFSLERVNNSPAVFELNKLSWINGEHLAMRDSKSLAEQVKPELEKRHLSIPSDDYLIQVVDLMKPRIRFVYEVATYSSYFFKDPQEYDPKGIKKRWYADASSYVLEYAKNLEDATQFTAESTEKALREVADKHGISAGKIIHPVRLAVTGITSGPSLFEILKVLGKEVVLRRLRKAANEIKL